MSQRDMRGGGDFDQLGEMVVRTLGRHQINRLRYSKSVAAVPKTGMPVAASSINGPVWLLALVPNVYQSR